jgi:hypothetical protein
LRTARTYAPVRSAQSCAARWTVDGGRWTVDGGRQKCINRLHTSKQYVVHYGLFGGREQYGLCYGLFWASGGRAGARPSNWIPCGGLSSRAAAGVADVAIGVKQSLHEQHSCYGLFCKCRNQGVSPNEFRPKRSHRGAADEEPLVAPNEPGKVNYPAPPQGNPAGRTIPARRPWGQNRLPQTSPRPFEGSTRDPDMYCIPRYRMIPVRACHAQGIALQ